MHNVCCGPFELSRAGRVRFPLVTVQAQAYRATLTSSVFFSVRAVLWWPSHGSERRLRALLLPGSTLHLLSLLAFSSIFPVTPFLWRTICSHALPQTAGLGGDNTRVRPIHCVAQHGRLVVQRGYCPLGIEATQSFPLFALFVQAVREGRWPGRWVWAGREERCAFVCLTGSVTSPVFALGHTTPSTCHLSKDWLSHLWAMNLWLSWVINQRQSPEKALPVKLF